LYAQDFPCGSRTNLLVWPIESASKAACESYFDGRDYVPEIDQNLPHYSIAAKIGKGGKEVSGSCIFRSKLNYRPKLRILNRPFSDKKIQYNEL
jgi:hypothetical protein